MSYATLRMVHLGWRVIRVEATPVGGRPTAGDPNRYIGREVAGFDRHSYFVAPNVGKEALALNLKSEQGQAVLARLVRELPVDVFCTNTMPARHEALGVSYDRLRAEREDLVWCCISAMGLKHPKVPGYDPVMQALCGYMDLTGPADGPPMQCGPPIIDLKAGDEAFTQVLLGLWQRDRTGQGRCIDVSMAQAAASWLHTFTPMLDMGSRPEELKRSGNEHRQFIPVNAYPTADGYVYMAIGSDAQFARFAQQEMFASLAGERYASNELRRQNKGALHDEIGAITARHPSETVSGVLAAAGIPHAPITPVEQVADLDFVASEALRTTTPDGETVRLPPPAVATDHLEATGRELPFAPSYGEGADRVLTEAGLGQGEIAALRSSGVIA